jgi:hypothetical protein
MPRWSYELNVSDVFHNDALTLTEKRDKIVARIRRASWSALTGVEDVVDELADVETVRDFDDAWSTFYDVADHHRVWVVTRS